MYILFGISQNKEKGDWLKAFRKKRMKPDIKVRMVVSVLEHSGLEHESAY